MKHLNDFSEADESTGIQFRTFLNNLDEKNFEEEKLRGLVEHLRIASDPLNTDVGVERAQAAIDEINKAFPKRNLFGKGVVLKGAFTSRMISTSSDALSDRTANEAAMQEIRSLDRPPKIETTSFRED